MPKTKARPVFPVQISNGKWAAADLLPEGGYTNPENDPLKRQFKTHEGCQLSCDFHNRYYGYKRKHVLDLIQKTLSLAVAS